MEAETKTKRYFCGHCEETVSRTTLYAHKRLYYNRTIRQWSKDRVSYPLEDRVHQSHSLTGITGPEISAEISEGSGVDTNFVDNVCEENVSGECTWDPVKL